MWLRNGSGQRRRLRSLTGDPARGRSFAPVVRAAAGAGAALAAVGTLGVFGGVVVLGVCGVLWWRLRRPRHRRLPVTADLPVVVGLLAAGMRAGATLPSCLASVSRAARGELGAELAGVAERLRLGASPEAAWESPALPEPLVAVGQDLARAADTGAPVADLLDRHVVDLRRAWRARGVARVERLSVLVVAPLGLCFLPAFVLIGVVPVAAELLWSALG
ncbi:type II secretion system F family protein [Nocardiopsis coralli]|uniref:type II secretion system F family protein n=1 Tax=Nocardiopsis coralli TaxID=2772213 RepID=UPI0038B28548